MKEKLIEILIYCLPAIIATLTCVVTTFKVMGGIGTWKDSINESNLKQVSKDLKAVVKRNLELNNEITKLLSENEELKASLRTKIESVIEEVESLKKTAEENIDKKEE